MSADLVAASPFDAIRRLTDAGREYWSARDLMPLLGYDSWRRFADAVGRAKIAARNSGHEVTRLFASAVKKSEGRDAEDYHLSRYACYLVALNGDPRKPEIAAAQTYFVIKTREAEVVQHQIPQTYAAALRAAADQTERAELAEAKVAELEPKAEVAELEPKAEVADRLLDADGDLSVRDAAQALTRAGIKVGATRLFAELERRRWIKRGGEDGRWRVLQSAIETGYMSVLPQSHYHPKTGVLVLDPPQPRVTPKGIQRLLADYDKS
ncbi:gp54 protein [Mycobacteroides abscessus subsp. massiliense]|uniref:phage antirepressor KilAC domain-containing protein n=1 Tax=Mycobacteroides abscessus TaxID=36809 RepID=UPI0009A5AA52|nr:phage antirepressor KilAC domain-containing protein [Mycobacteroides abscessus]SKX38284.1 gp54 protein [Mycobacteroides abscessus subsp. massiliense]